MKLSVEREKFVLRSEFQVVQPIGYSMNKTIHIGMCCGLTEINGRNKVENQIRQKVVNSVGSILYVPIDKLLFKPGTFVYRITGNGDEVGTYQFGILRKIKENSVEVKIEEGKIVCWERTYL